MGHTYNVCSKCQALNKVDSEKALQKAPQCGKCGEKLAIHGLVSPVTSSAFDRIVAKSELPVVVDFWASWCGPCQMYGPEFESASKTQKQAVFLKVSTETEQALAARLGIRGIPCTIVFKNGREVARQSGVMNTQQIAEFLQRV